MKYQRGEILDKAKQIISKDRNATHGEPEDSFAPIAELWTMYLKYEAKRNPLPKGAELTLTSYDVAMMMALFKHGRLMLNPTHEDNYLDEVGYTAIAASMILKKPTDVENEPKRPFAMSSEDARILNESTLKQEGQSVVEERLTAERLILGYGGTLNSKGFPGARDA